MSSILRVLEGWELGNEGLYRKYLPYKKKIEIFMMFYVTSISYINPYFRAPSPLKPLKSSPRYQNLPGESLTAHSDQKTANIDQETAKYRRMLIAFPI